MEHLDKKTNIIMIGMPASGKSTIGKALATRYSFDYIDVDVVIEEKYGMKLKGIIDRYGDDKFRDIEGEVNASLDVQNSVIAPGGSVIYSEYAMEHFKEIGTIVYLEVSYEDIAKRLGDLRARGITFKEGQTLRDLYDERKPYYERYADITCNENGRNISRVVEDICQKYELLREK